MAAIGALIFCNACGDLLPPTTGDPNKILVCFVCGTQTKDIKFEPVITKSKPNAFPSALRAKHTNVQTLTEADIKGEALMQHSCTECGNETMFYHEKQLRSADEGTTIFYTCPICDHRENTNN